MILSKINKISSKINEGNQTKFKLVIPIKMLIASIGKLSAFPIEYIFFMSVLGYAVTIIFLNKILAPPKEKPNNSISNNLMVRLSAKYHNTVLTILIIINTFIHL